MIVVSGTRSSAGRRFVQATTEVYMDRDEERAGRRDQDESREEDLRGREGKRDEDELRVQRSEEELRAGTREREAGEVGVRKNVRTEHEQVRVPKRREEVSVDRVPVDEERTDAEIGDDEVSVPVVEEEVVVDKQPVVKEEIRIRKDVVEDEEVVEEDVRKEEVDVDDATTTGQREGELSGAEGRTDESHREEDLGRSDQQERRPEDEQRGRDETQSEGFIDKAKRKLGGQ